MVSDLLGKLYNKDAILEFLLPTGDDAPASGKADYEQILEGRVRGLRDVVEVKFEVEKETDKAKNGSLGSRGERWICPVTHKALGPGVKAVYLVPCGHAFSESAVKEISSQNCLQVSSHLLCSYPSTRHWLIDRIIVQRTLHARERHPNTPHRTSGHATTDKPSRKSERARTHAFSQESHRSRQEAEEERQCQRSRCSKCRK